MKIDEAVKHLRGGTKRKFSQTFDLVISLKNIDLKKPENKFSKDVILPHGKGKDVNVGIISDSIKGAITKSDIEQLDKKGIKKLAKKYDFFVCEAPLMVFVGKVLGKYLGPKGKMPRLMPPNKDHNEVIEDIKKSVRIRLTNSPSINVPVGTENMDDTQLKENSEKVLDEVKKALPKGDSQIKGILLKTTMGKPVKIG